MSVALVLLHELAAPYPGTETTRADLLDRLLAGMDDAHGVARRDRIKWALAAGGEVR